MLLFLKRLKDLFKSNGALQSSFKALSPYKQKEYCEYIDSAKRESTIKSRLEKIVAHDFEWYWAK